VLIAFFCLSSLLPIDIFVGKRRKGCPSAPKLECFLRENESYQRLANFTP
jgi:hypothetical protein